MAAGAARAEPEWADEVSYCCIYSTANLDLWPRGSLGHGASTRS